MPTAEFWRLQERTDQLDRRMTEAERRQTEREKAVDAHFDRIEQKVEKIPMISGQLEDLKGDLRDVATELHTFITMSGANRRSDWSLAGQFGTLIVAIIMMLIAIASVAITLLHGKL